LYLVNTDVKIYESIKARADELAASGKIFWNAAFTALPILFLFLLPNQSPDIVNNIHIYIYICIYTRISDFVGTAYELPLLPNNTVRGTFLHISGAVRSVD